MDYGGGDKYVGEWRRGKEHGAGQLYKKGVATVVTYCNSVLQSHATPAPAAGNPVVGKEKVPGCQQGDCVNGYGVLGLVNEWAKAGLYTGEDGKSADGISITNVYDKNKVRLLKTASSGQRNRLIIKFYQP